MIQFCNPDITAEMLAAANDALVNERWTGGESVDKFEEEFANFIGAKHAVSVNNGTNALMLTQMALGLRYKGILTTPMSFIATANSIVHAENCPVFVDITDLLEMNMSTVWNQQFTEGKGAVIPVSLYGHRTNLETVRKYCDDFKLKMIEDNAQWHWKGSGVLGDAACYSFYSTKNMTVCGDGGMVVTDNGKLADIVRSLANCGRGDHSSHPRIGYTARMSTVGAAIGRVQLRHLDDWNHRRAHLAGRYHEGLDQLPGVTLAKGSDRSSWHIYNILCDNRTALKSFLAKQDIQTMVHYPNPIHLQEVYRKMYGYSEGRFPIAEKIANQTLSLPMYPSLGEDDVKTVCEAIRRFYS